MLTASFDGVLNGKIRGREALKFTLSSTEIICEENSYFSIDLSAVVGVKLENGGLNMVAYELNKPKKSCFGCFSSSTPFYKRKELFLKPSTLEDQNICKLWHAKISWAISRLISEPADLEAQFKANKGADLPLPSRRRLLLYVNPFSGTKKALQVLEKTIRPILENDAGADLTIIKTERQNHALEHVQSYENLASEYDGVVIVSGDGLLFEVVQGVMARNDWREVVQKLSFGIIPAGSGNGLATSFIKKVHPLMSADDGFTNSVIIALNNNVPMDLLAVDVIKEVESTEDLEKGLLSPEVKRLYSFLSLEWAASSYIDIGSEAARFLGSLRFTLWGVLSIIKKTRYTGVLSYLPATAAESAKSAKDPSVPKVPSYWEKDDGVSEVPLTQFMPNASSKVPDNWKSVSSKKFVSMWNTNVAWMAGDACISPDADLADGYIQMSYLDGGRGDMVRYLLSLENANATSLKCVKAFPTQCYRLQPLDFNKKKSSKGKFNRFICIDGESIEYTTIQVENLCGFLKVMAPPEKK